MTKAGFEEPDAELDKLAYAVIGAAIDVHKSLGRGFLEAVYHRALVHELRKRGMKAEEEKEFEIWYDGVVVGSGKIDILVNDRLVVEVKAVTCFASYHEAQIRHYLKAGHYRLGLLLNFHEELMKDGVQRVVWSESAKPPSPLA